MGEIPATLQRARVSAFEAARRQPRPQAPQGAWAGVQNNQQTVPSLETLRERNEQDRTMAQRVQRRETYAPREQRELQGDGRNQVAETGQFVLELTGLPSLVRSRDAFREGRYGEGAFEGAMGLLGVTAPLGFGGATRQGALRTARPAMQAPARVEQSIAGSRVATPARAPMTEPPPRPGALSPAQRAPDAGGWSTDKYFHRARAPVEGELRPSEGGRLGPGVYISRDRPIQLRRDIDGEAREGENVLPLQVRQGRFIREREYEAVWARHAAPLERAGNSNSTRLAHDAAQAELARKGYIGAEAGSDDIVVWDAANVRSRFAQRPNGGPRDTR